MEYLELFHRFMKERMILLKNSNDKFIDPGEVVDAWGPSVYHGGSTAPNTPAWDGLRPGARGSKAINRESENS